MKIAILGCGHMGSWLAEELSLSHFVAAMDPLPARVNAVDKVNRLKTLDELADFKPELLINAVPLKETIPVFKSVTGKLPKNCILCDVASVKGKLPQYYAECGRPFASVHPMFGPTFANIRRLEEESAVIIRESDCGTADFFRTFFTGKGLKIFDYSFDEHDGMMAYSLAMPFISTMVFTACMDKNTVPGTTFKKHREIAKGLLSENDYLLAEILFNPHSAVQLEKVISRMEFMRHIIRGRDYEEAIRFFNGLRENLMNSETGPM
ncbi:MAG: prephenate dehydrogenase [Acidobacteria bacterium]|nr:prephenate dehydrogenase [Acidobacteriota bacterium]